MLELLIVMALNQRLGFESFTEEVEDVLKDHKQQQKVCTFLIFAISIDAMR